ncbi:helix-turn-helix domain-containing protein [Neobacillus cucumis]|uniref:helix-turn-helix domain-containing protein n=1 Tax=Neobacillus cucumis TaxID=1740721 RepID=UPI002040F17B|nr:AraC family transcriptional regulator [Neobacillus cucumis]
MDKIDYLKNYDIVISIGKNSVMISFRHEEAIFMTEYLKMNVSSPIEFVLGGKLISTEPFTHMKRTMPLCEIIIGINEILYMECNGIDYEVKPGDVLFVLPNQLHLGYKECQAGLSFYWFHVLLPDDITIMDEMTMGNQARILQSNPYPKESNHSILLPIYSTPKRIDRINILCNQILDVAHANYFNRYAASYLTTSLLIELSEQTITNFQDPLNSTYSDSKLVKILEWIRVNALDSNISTNSIAKTFNYNRDYLSRFFKTSTGMNVQEYIHILKLSKAKDLLISTNMNIGKIAHLIGINDERYFMRLFKKYEKVTPTEYRQAYHRIPLNRE